MKSLKATRAARLKFELATALGGKCSRCPAVSALEFDCVVPQGPAHHRLDFPAKIRWYWQEYSRGNLQLLCRACHQRKTVEENRKVRAATRYTMITMPFGR